MRLLASLFAVSFASTVAAQQLHNYNQILYAVEEGKLVRLVIDYTKCDYKKNLVIPNNHALYTPNAMAIRADGAIGTYLMYFTRNDAHFPGQSVYQNTRFEISPDSFIKLTFTVLSAADYSLLANEGSCNCKIDEGVKVFLNSDSDARILNKS